MKLRTWILIVLYGAIICGGSMSIYFWATQTQSISLIHILGGVEQNLAKPVFAQFIATQTLRIQGQHTISALVIPLYIPATPQSITIKLYNNDSFVTWWKIPTNNSQRNGIFYVRLPFIVPTSLKGNIEVQLNGSQIAYADQGSAPGFFVESDDAAYPYGNYRIAQNQKQGDIAMELIEQKANFTLYLEDFSKDPVGRITFLCAACAFFLVLMLLPSEILRLRMKLRQAA